MSGKKVAIRKVWVEKLRHTESVFLWDDPFDCERALTLTTEQYDRFRKAQSDWLRAQRELRGILKEQPDHVF